MNTGGEGKTESGSRARQLSALLASLTILGAAAIYWVIQIQAVREMLELAYG